TLARVAPWVRARWGMSFCNQFIDRVLVDRPGPNSHSARNPDARTSRPWVSRSLSAFARQDDRLRGRRVEADQRIEAIGRRIARAEEHEARGRSGRSREGAIAAGEQLREPSD